MNVRGHQSDIPATQGFDDRQRLLSVSVGRGRPAIEYHIFFGDVTVERPQWKDVAQIGVGVDARDDQFFHLSAREKIHPFAHAIGSTRQHDCAVGADVLTPRINGLRGDDPVEMAKDQAESENEKHPDKKARTFPQKRNHLAAVTSISTFTPFGNPATATVERAGGCSGKKRP